MIRFRAALRALLNATNPYATSHTPGSPSTTTAGPNPTRTSASVDCCICLCAIGPFQALFVAPCSHCYHYKCVQPLLNQGAMFQCALCRQVANLAASVSMDSLAELGKEEEDEMERELMKEMGFEGWGAPVPNGPAAMDVVAQVNVPGSAAATAAARPPAGVPPQSPNDDSSDGEGGDASGDGEGGRATTPTGRVARRPAEEGRRTVVNSTEGLEGGRVSDPETDGEGIVNARRRAGTSPDGDNGAGGAVEGDHMDLDGDGGR
ncbi:hypothetical protein HDU93_004503 [Gonapodya sp. JEL0774]|nr:hypothetical protein HDU93_004503 [Gonapodya sp. JEL0774]